MASRRYRSWVIRPDEEPPTGFRMWMADVIEYHWRCHVLRHRRYTSLIEATLSRPWRWLAGA